MIRTGRGDRAVTSPATLPHQVAQPGVAMGAEHDEARVVLAGSVDDGLPGRSSLDRQCVRSEPGRVGQRRTAAGSLLGGLPDVVPARGVELRVRLGTEPDVERSPDGKDSASRRRGS